MIIRPLTECPRCQQEVTEIHPLTGQCISCTSDMSVRQINRLARQNDESEKWPVRGKFDVTERAIRRLQRRARESGIPNLGGIAYASMLEGELSKIVNDPSL